MEVRCGDGVALAGLVVAKLEVSAVPGDRCGGSKDGVRVEVTSELGWVWMLKGRASAAHHPTRRPWTIMSNSSAHSASFFPVRSRGPKSDGPKLKLNNALVET